MGNKDKPITLVVVLALICAVASLALAFTYSYCKERIFLQIKQTEEAARSKVLAEAEKFEKVDEPFQYYKGFSAAGDLVGYTFEGSVSGYSSTIKVTVGVDPEAGMVTGIYVTSQQETPGLGATMTAIKSEGTLWSAIASIGRKVEQASADPEPYFQVQFRNKSIANLKVVKTADPDYIQALTGATISSKAVTEAVTTAVTKFRNQVLDNQGENQP